MLRKSYTIRPFEFIVFNGTMKKLAYIYFTSESNNKQYIARLCREKIKNNPELADWSVARIEYYDYQTGQYETYTYIHNANKKKT